MPALRPAVNRETARGRSAGLGDQDAEDRGGEGNQARDGQKLLLLPLDGIRFPLRGVRFAPGHISPHSGQGRINISPHSGQSRVNS